MSLNGPRTLSSSGYLLKQLTMKEEKRRNKNFQRERERYLPRITDTNLRWTLNELFDVPLYLENRIRAERRLLITVLGQASINSENSSEQAESCNTRVTFAHFVSR